MLHILPILTVPASYAPRVSFASSRCPLDERSTTSLLPTLHLRPRTDCKVDTLLSNKMKIILYIHHLYIHHYFAVGGRFSAKETPSETKNTRYIFVLLANLYICHLNKLLLPPHSLLSACRRGY